MTGRRIFHELRAKHGAEIALGRVMRPALASREAEPELDPKAVSTLQARAAIAGYELVPLADKSFVVARWGMVRALADVAAVRGFLEQVGAA